MYSEQILAMQVKQKLAPKALEQLASAKMVNEYLEKQKDEIERVCRRTVACEHLSKLENLEVSGDDLFAEVEKAKAEFEEFGTPYDENQLYAQAQETLERARVQVVKRKLRVKILPRFASSRRPSPRRKVTKTIWLSLLHPSPLPNHLARISSAGRALPPPSLSGGGAMSRIQRVRESEVPDRERHAHDPGNDGGELSLRLERFARERIASVLGRRRPGRRRVFIVIFSVVVARGRGALARDRGRDRETPRPRVIASLARVGANAMASRVEVSRWTRIVTLIIPRAMTSRDASQTPPSSVNWNALLQWCVSRASSPTHRARASHSRIRDRLDR